MLKELPLIKLSEAIIQYIPLASRVLALVRAHINRDISTLS